MPEVPIAVLKTAIHCGAATIHIERCDDHGQPLPDDGGVELEVRFGRPACGGKGYAIEMLGSDGQVIARTNSLNAQAVVNAFGMLAAALINMHEHHKLPEAEYPRPTVQA